MVLITEALGGGLKVTQNGTAAGSKMVDGGPVASPARAEDELDDCSSDSEDSERNYWEDEDDVYEDYEELDFEALPDREEDARSVLSDDSFYPPEDAPASPSSSPPPPPWRAPSPEPVSLFKACSNNNGVIVKIMIRQGVSEGEVRETDKNRRTGLIVACYQGYVDVVIALAQCPHLDVNWQDNEGNTALITAVQAGHVMISNYLLNYFPKLDIERRNCHGFTAMMKAAMQGRSECVRALMMAGGDVEARDYGRQQRPREWALFTGRYDTASLMERLMAQPCAEQFCTTFSLEWPMLKELVSQSQEPKSCWRRLSNLLVCCPLLTFNLSNKVNPVDDGVLDHMVRVTTGLASPPVATACRTVCPESPPRVGKRRFAVSEILRRRRVDRLRRPGPESLDNYTRLFQNSRVLLIPRATERRASLQPQLLREVAAVSSVAVRRASLLPLHMMRRSSMRPGRAVPKVRLCKAPAPAREPERARRRRHDDPAHLQIPRWTYRMRKEERKRDEEERQKLLPLIKRK